MKHFFSEKRGEEDITCDIPNLLLYRWEKSEHTISSSLYPSLSQSNDFSIHSAQSEDLNSILHTRGNVICKVCTFRRQLVWRSNAALSLSGELWFCSVNITLVILGIWLALWQVNWTFQKERLQRPFKHHQPLCCVYSMEGFLVACNGKFNTWCLDLK